MKFATLHDVASLAGVSYATVDRVVNNRGGVAQKSISRVRDAIDSLGYERDESAANLARQRVFRFHFLLPDDSNDFFSALAAALVRQQSESNLLRTRIQTTRVPAFSEQAIIKALDEIDTTSTDCICVVALDTPAVGAAIERAKMRGLKLVTLVSDGAQEKRDGYIGIDNLVAGKMAGRMMGLAHTRRAGKILPIIGANRAYDHTQRLDGFYDILRRNFPSVAPLEPAQSFDDAETIKQVLAKAMSSHPDLTGVYNMGAGNVGLVDWVNNIAPSDRPVIIVHELLPNTRAALEANLIDAVIDQKPYAAIGQALRIMRNLVDGTVENKKTTLITPAIYLCENLPLTDTPPDRTHSI